MCSDIHSCRKQDEILYAASAARSVSWYRTRDDDRADHGSCLGMIKDEDRHAMPNHGIVADQMVALEEALCNDLEPRPAHRLDL